MSERSLLAVFVILAAVSLALFFTLLAQAAETPLLVHGYISAYERGDDYSALCEGPMRAVANGKIVGRGETLGGTYYVYLQPGWEQSGSIDFEVFDISYVHCAGKPTNEIREKMADGRANIELRCGFEKIGCSYYFEYGPDIEGEEPQYLSKLRYTGTKRVYKYLPYR